MSSRRRKKIPLSVQLAAALAELQVYRGTALPYQWLKLLTASQFLSLFQVDHAVLVANDGSDHFSNITHRFIGVHREKTKRDVKELARGKRIARAHATHKAKMAEKMMAIDVRGDRSDGYSSRPKRKIPSRPFPKHQRGFR